MDENQVMNQDVQAMKENPNAGVFKDSSTGAASQANESLGRRIARLRKERGMTQDQLASLVGVTFQAVSKWENDLACPDVTILPVLADIFGISMDELFGRERRPSETNEKLEKLKEDRTEDTRENHTAEESFGSGYTGGEFVRLPWEDDEKLRIVVFDGQKLLAVENLSEQIRNIHVELEGAVKDVISYLSVTCDGVCGNATAGGDITCDSVEGGINAGGSVTCDSVEGDVRAGGDVTCDSLEGNITAGGDVHCDDVEGNITAGGDVSCGDVEGNVSAGGDANCGDVEGDVRGEGDITCGDVEGDIHAGGAVYRN